MSKRKPSKFRKAVTRAAARVLDAVSTPESRGIVLREEAVADASVQLPTRTAVELREDARSVAIASSHAIEQSMADHSVAVVLRGEVAQFRNEVAMLSQRIWHLEHPGKQVTGIGVYPRSSRQSIRPEVTRRSLHDEAEALIAANELAKRTPTEQRAAAPGDFEHHVQAAIGEANGLDCVPLLERRNRCG